MSNSIFLTVKTVAAIVLVLALSACGSTQPRFYQLSSLQAQGVQQPASEPCLNIGVGPVKLPGYVDRPQIVTRGTPNQLILARFDRWAEPLGDNVSRVLAENLSTLLCAKNVSLFPWTASTPLDYRVEVEVLRMDGTLGKDAVLEGWWTIYDTEKRELASRRSSYIEPAANQDYGALVQAQSRTIADLSRDVAGALKEISKAGPRK